MKKMPLPRDRAAVIILLLLIAGCGVAAVLYATWRGGAMNPDSVIYVDAARSILDGGGYASRAMNCISADCSPEWIPVTRFPPLYPALIAGVAFVLAMDPAAAARWINALLHGANSLLVALAVLRFSRGSVTLSALGSLIMISSVVMLNVHTMIGTEPLFLFLGLGGLLMIVAYIGGEGRGWLAAGACAVALAWLDRYVGVALVLTAVSGILLSNRTPIPCRVRDSLLFLVVSTLPIAGFLARNMFLAGDAVNRRFSFSPVTADFCRAAMFTLSSWFFPGSDRFDLLPFQHLLTWTMTALIIAGFLIVGVLLWRRSLEQDGAASCRSRLGRTPLLILIFVTAYLGLLILAKCTVDPGVHLSNRHMACVYGSCLILVLYTIPAYFSPSHTWRRTRTWMIAAGLGYAAVSLGAGVVWVSYCHENGRALNGSWWRELDIGEQLRRFPPETPLFAAEAESLYAIFLYAGRVACPIQAFEDGKPQWIAHKKGELEEHTGLFLRYDPPGRPPRSREHSILPFPSLPEIAGLLSRHGLRLQPLDVKPGREVYRVVPKAHQRQR